MAFGEFFPGWGVGLLLGTLGGRAFASRRPELATSPPAELSGRWQSVLVAILVVAVIVALVVALSN